MPRLLHKIYEDSVLQPVHDQGDSAVMWLDSGEYCEQRSLTRNESFINYLKQSDVKEPAKELRPSASQNLLKPPALGRHAESSSPSRGLVTGGAFELLKRESLVEILADKSDHNFDEQPTLDAERMFSNPERMFSNPEEKCRRRLEFNTPKRGKQQPDRRVVEAPSPIHDLYADKQFADFTRTRVPDSSSSLFPSMEPKPAAEGPKKTSEFYMEYLKSIRKTTQTATLKPRRDLELDPLYYDSGVFFGSSKSYKNLGASPNPNLTRS